MHASCLQMLPNFTQALQSAAARRNLSSPGTSLGFKNPRINPVPIAEPTNARDMDLHARGTIITAKKIPNSIQANNNCVPENLPIFCA